MPLEKSVLNDNLIKELILLHYNFDICSVQKINMGTANCYKISDGTNQLFLKEFQSGFSKEDLLCECKLVNYLSEHNFPTACIQVTIDENVYFTFEDRLFYLQEFINGKTYGNNNLPHNLLMEAGRLLGVLHNLLLNYDLPIGMDEEWVKSFSPDTTAAEYDRLLQLANENYTDPNYKNIKSDLLYKKHLTYRIVGFAEYYKDITYCSTHGDYTEFQFICDDNHIKAVIDFSSSGKLPVAWEIMRSYIQSCGACKKGVEFNIKDFCVYVQEYMKFALLTKQDLISMPYVYLFQLAISKYGYKEYLITKSENRESLLQFAFWRTDICREIEKKADDISKALSELI